METLNATKICNLSPPELGRLLKSCFFQVGKKFELEQAELSVFVQNIMKYQGRMSVSDFEDAFAMFAAGELNIDNLAITVSPLFVGRLMKAYKTLVGANPSVCPNPSAGSHQLSNEQAWNSYMRCILTYCSIPANPDWIALFNHCAYKGWISDVRPIEHDGQRIPFNYKVWKLAKHDVLTFTQANWGHLITNPNMYDPKKGSTAKGIGTRLKENLMI